MTTQSPRTTSQPWQEAIDPRLVARLLQRVTKPGVISTRMAEPLLARLQSANQSSPLVAELLQRYGSEELFRDDHVPIVYAHLPQISEFRSADRVTAATLTTPQRFGHSPNISTDIVRSLEQTERPVIVGSFVSRIPQGHAKRERIDKVSSTMVSGAMVSGQPQSSPVPIMPQEHSTRAHPDKRLATQGVDQSQSVPVVTVQRRRPQVTERGETTRIIVHPTRIVREDVSDPATFSRGVIHNVGQTSTPGQPSAKLPSVHDKTSGGELSPRQEVTPRIFPAPQEVVRPHTGASVARTATHPQSPSRQHPVVTESRRLLTLTPPTLTLVRSASPSTENGGTPHLDHRREPHVQPLSGASLSRELSLSSGTTLRSSQTGTSTTSMPIAKVASPSTPMSAIPARELHALTEKVQQKLDIDALTEKVQRQLRRRLLVEHERRGRTRWT